MVGYPHKICLRETKILVKDLKNTTSSLHLKLIVSNLLVSFFI